MMMSEAKLMHLKVRLPNGQERYYELDPNATSEYARDLFLKDDPTVGKGQYKQYRMKILETGELIKASGQPLGVLMGKHAEAEVTISFIKRISTINALKASALRAPSPERGRVGTTTTATPPKERKMFYKRRGPSSTVVGSAPPDPLLLAHPLSTSQPNLFLRREGQNTVPNKAVDDCARPIGASMSVASSSLTQSNGAAGFVRARPNLPAQQPTWGTVKRTMQGSSAITLGAQKFHTPTQFQSLDRKGLQSTETVLKKDVREQTASEEDKTGSGSEMLDSGDDDDTNEKSQSSSISCENGEGMASDDDAGEYEPVDGSERESGTETNTENENTENTENTENDRSELGSDSDDDIDLFNYDYENEDIRTSSEEGFSDYDSLREEESEASTLESEDQGSDIAESLYHSDSLLERPSTRMKKGPSVLSVDRRATARLLSRRPSAFKRSDPDKDRSSTMKRRRQTTQAQLKIQNATGTVLVREMREQEKDILLKPLTLCLRYNGQEVTLHCPVSETVESIIAAAVIKFKGAIKVDALVELLAENDVVLSPADPLTAYPSIIESFYGKSVIPTLTLREFRSISGEPRRSLSTTKTVVHKKRTLIKNSDYELDVMMPDGSVRTIRCLYKDTPKNLKEVLQSADMPPTHMKKFGFRLADGNRDGVCLSEDLALSKLARIHECLKNGKRPTVQFVERDIEAVKQEQKLKVMIGDLVGKPLCWTQEQDEVTVFRESACRQRYLERQERLRSIKAGGVPLQLSENDIGTHPSQIVVFVAPPAFADPNGVKKAFAVKGPMTANDLLEEAFKKLVSRKLPDRSAQDFLLQVTDVCDYIDGPYPMHSFKYIRQCITTKERPNLVMVERKLIAPEKPLPVDDPMDAEELVDPTFRNDHKLLSIDAKPWEQLTCFSLWDMARSFRVRIVGVEKINPNTSSFQKASGKSDIFEANLSLYVTAGLYHGGTLLSPLVRTSMQSCTRNPRWLEWVNFSIKMCNLPHAARLCFTLWAKPAQSKDVPLGWVACQLFDYKNELKTGLLALNLWHNEEANPIGMCGSNPSSTEMPLFVELDEYPLPVVFPTEPLYPNGVPQALLSASTSSQSFVEAKSRTATPDEEAKINWILHRDSLCPLKPEEKQLLWEHRYELLSKPKSLPKFLLSVAYEDRYQVQEMHHLLAKWPHFSNPVDALELLDAKFADAAVRQYAVDCLDDLSNEQLCDYLLQLVQVLKYELYHDSALSRFLLRRALRSREVGHALYWYLKSEMHVPTITERYGLLLEAYLRGCGSHRQELKKQEEVLKEMTRIANKIKEVKDPDKRKETLLDELKKFTEKLDKTPGSKPFQLPLDPKLQARGLLVQKCKYMDSKKLPLWLVWENEDPSQPAIYTIFKSGDDLRQDMLTLQMLRIMDKLWKSEGLDLQMSPYGCISTGDNLGMIEVVTQSETTAKISLAAAGVKGAFALDPIANWLAEKNSKEGQYRKAVDNFISSCAGYCVATYVLGIGDRHNDNIMLNESGRLFHIDFGHFLGNYKKKLGIKREKAPFVLTPDFAYVMGGRESKDFKIFCDKCCKAYNILRKHSNMFINLFCMMLSTGIPELRSPNDIRYLRQSLSVDATDEEAAEKFQKLIYQSLDTKTTQFNNFSHMVFHRK